MQVFSSKKLTGFVIMGYGGHAQDMLDIYWSNRDKTGFYQDDLPYLIGFLDDYVEHKDVIGKIDDFPRIIEEEKHKQGRHVGPDNVIVQYLIGVNSSEIRAEIDERVWKLVHMPEEGILIHKTAHIGINCQVGRGTVMGPFSALTSNVSLGDHVHINTGASVNQGSNIGNYCTLSPGVKICGDVEVGDRVSFGANSTVINLKKVGDNSIIGAGAVVINDIPANSVAVGVPAKVIKETV